MSDAQQLVNISAPRGKTAAQCERQFVCAATSIVVAENSFMKKVLKLTAMLGLAVLMIPLSANAQEHDALDANSHITPRWTGN
jgi:hypothetical protein